MPKAAPHADGTVPQAVSDVDDSDRGSQVIAGSWNSESGLFTPRKPGESAMLNHSHHIYVPGFGLFANSYGQVARPGGASPLSNSLKAVEYVDVARTDAGVIRLSNGKFFENPTEVSTGSLSLSLFLSLSLSPPLSFSTFA